MDLSDYKPKVDHFEQLHALGQENVVVGAHNFRQVDCSILSHLPFKDESFRLKIFQYLAVLNLQKRDSPKCLRWCQNQLMRSQ